MCPGRQLGAEVFRRWRSAGLTAVAIMLGIIALASANTGSVRTFYLNAKVGQCAIFRTSTPKVLRVVPCSNARHNLEVYAVAHGGWGQNAVPANAYSRVRSICLSSVPARPRSRPAPPVRLAGLLARSG